MFKKPESNEFDLQHQNKGRVVVPYIVLTNRKAAGYLNPLQVSQTTEQQRKELDTSLRNAKGQKEDV